MRTGRTPFGRILGQDPHPLKAGRCRRVKGSPSGPAEGRRAKRGPLDAWVDGLLAVAVRIAAPARLARVKRVLAIAAGFLIVVIGASNLIVWLGGRSPVTTDTSKVPHAQA